MGLRYCDSFYIKRGDVESKTFHPQIYWQLLIFFELIIQAKCVKPVLLLMLLQFGIASQLMFAHSPSLERLEENTNHISFPKHIHHISSS